MQWFVMRDLKRANARRPAYVELGEAGFCVFTPLVTRIVEQRGRRERRRVPFIPDLLFVKSDRERLDRVVARTDTLQYRYVAGAPYCTALTVPHADMERFIAAVGTDDNKVEYLAPGEITPQMLGRRAEVICPGPLNGHECRLVSMRGSRKKRILVEVAGLLAAMVEVSPDYIRLL